MLRWISILLRVYLPHLFLCQHLLGLRETEWQCWWALHNCLCTKKKKIMFGIWGEEEINITFLNLAYHLLCSLVPQFVLCLFLWWVSCTMFRDAKRTLRPDPRPASSDTSENCNLSHYCCFFSFHIYFYKRFFSFFCFQQEVSVKEGSNMKSWTRKCHATVYFMTPNEILMVLLKASRLTTLSGKFDNYLHQIYIELIKP